MPTPKFQHAVKKRILPFYPFVGSQPSLGRKGYTLDRSPAHHRAKTLKQTTIHTLIHTWQGQFKSPFSPCASPWREKAEGEPTWPRFDPWTFFLWPDTVNPCPSVTSSIPKIVKLIFLTCISVSKHIEYKRMRKDYYTSPIFHMGLAGL